MSIPNVFTSFAAGAALALIATAARAEPFPPVALPGTEIINGASTGREFSGALWHTNHERLYVVGDSGTLHSMLDDGSDLTLEFSFPDHTDLEGIAVADPSSNFIYLGVENPDSILEFDLTGNMVTRSFDLTGSMNSSEANKGLEALTFVPDAANPEGGLFYAGLQENAGIYMFSLPILTSETLTTVTHVGTLTQTVVSTDISGLHYDAPNDVLYSIYDTANKLLAMRPDGMLLMEWNLPGDSQEGFTVHGSSVFVTQDGGAYETDSDEIYRYDNFPVPEPSTLILLATEALGVLAFGWRRRKRTT